MIPFAPPKIDNKIIDEVVETLKSGWITTGPKTKLFERKITNYCGNKKTLCVSSATAGLELVLRWFGIKDGDEVIVPAYTYCATANVVMHCGATPVLVDVNDDFNISLDNIRKAITNKTKVIMPVDIGGLPCDYEAINLLVKEEKLSELFQANNEVQKKLGRILILSDAAHSIGAIYKNKKTGSLTDISVFSFHAVKNLTTAEGGAICFNLPDQFNSEEIYKNFNIMSLHGQSKDALAKTQKGAWRYDVIENGYKANMTDILASIGLVEIDRYENDTIKKRKQIVNQYYNAFKNKEWAELPIIKNEIKESAYHLFMLRIKNINESIRDTIIERIFSKQIAVNVHFQPLPLLSIFRNKGYKIKNYPISYDIYSREISLPVYYSLTKEQVDLIIRVVIEEVESIILKKNSKT